MSIPAFGERAGFLIIGNSYESPIIKKPCLAGTHQVRIYRRSSLRQAKNQKSREAKKSLKQIFWHYLRGENSLHLQNKFLQSFAVSAMSSK
ncbi:UNVERIFIED_ORG: hypothetical protein B5F06_08950 [Lacrimispora saccharolytica]